MRTVAVSVLVVLLAVPVVGAVEVGGGGSTTMEAPPTSSSSEDRDGPTPVPTERIGWYLRSAAQDAILYVHTDNRTYWVPVSTGDVVHAAWTFTKDRTGDPCPGPDDTYRVLTSPDTVIWKHEDGETEPVMALRPDGVLAKTGNVHREADEEWSWTCEQVPALEPPTLPRFAPHGSAGSLQVSLGTRKAVAEPDRPAGLDPTSAPPDRAPAGGTSLGRPDVPAPIDPALLLVTAAVGLAAFVLYRRLRQEDLQEHPLRRRILDRVADDPAIRAGELADLLDVDVTTVLYHARVMAEADLVSVRRVHGAVHLLPVGAEDARRQRIRAALRSKAKRRLTRLLVADPDLSVTEIAERVDRHPSTVQRHADALVEEGVLRSRKDGRRRRFSPTEAARAVVDGDRDG